jgi:hypothetical protein
VEALEAKLAAAAAMGPGAAGLAAPEGAPGSAALAAEVDKLREDYSRACEWPVGRGVAVCLGPRSSRRLH